MEGAQKASAAAAAETGGNFTPLLRLRRLAPDATNDRRRKRYSNDHRELGVGKVRI